MNDPIGKAIKYYFQTGKEVFLNVGTTYTENELLPVSYFFRSYEEMPEYETLALDKTKGLVLDLGAGAGCHTLYLQEDGFEVDALESSETCIEIMKKRGVENAFCEDFFTWNTDKKYDTILLLMNGLGMAQSLDNLPAFLKGIRELLSDTGVCYGSGADLMYLIQEDDGSFYIDLNGPYYGEIEYSVEYKGENARFPWLFLDRDMLRQKAEDASLDCQFIWSGEEGGYLCELRKI